MASNATVIMVRNTRSIMVLCLVISTVVQTNPSVLREVLINCSRIINVTELRTMARTNGLIDAVSYYFPHVTDFAVRDSICVFTRFQGHLSLLLTNDDLTTLIYASGNAVTN